MESQGLLQAISEAGYLPLVFQIVVFIATGLISLLISICLFFIVRIFKELDIMKQEHTDMKERCPVVHTRVDLDLAKFKTEVSRKYAEKATITRLHERFDANAEAVSRRFDDHSKAMNQRFDKVITMLNSGVNA